MRKRQVAVLDFGSSGITAAVGERGINKTFIIKSRAFYEYDGFQGGVFFDTGRLASVLKQAVDGLKKNFPKGIESVYVGVPGEFTEIEVKESQISFSRKKKIQEEDIDTLFDAAFVLQSKKYTLINRSAIVYELGDGRRLANPLGSTSEILKGKLSFILCSDYFIENVEPAIKNAGIMKVEFVSSVLAEALYLVDAETRDRIAVIADIGYIGSSFFIIQGDGILFKRSFSYGGGYITAALTERFDLDFSVAESLKRKVNLSSKPVNGAYDLISCDNGEFYSGDEVKEVILNSLDLLCEDISNALDEFGYNVPEYVPLMITGGGIAYIRGAKEHVAGRLGMSVQVVSPNVPLMDKPTESSLLSLLDLALEQD